MLVSRSDGIANGLNGIVGDADGHERWYKACRHRFMVTEESSPIGPMAEHLATTFFRRHLDFFGEHLNSPTVSTMHLWRLTMRLV